MNIVLKFKADSVSLKLRDLVLQSMVYGYVELGNIFMGMLTCTVRLLYLLFLRVILQKSFKAIMKYGSLGWTQPSSA